MKGWGLSDEAAALYVEARKPKPQPFFFVYSENWDSIQFFRIVERQWIAGAMGGFIGLNFQSIDIIINRRNLTVTPQMFEDLMTIEMVLLPILNKK